MASPSEPAQTAGEPLDLEKADDSRADGPQSPSAGDSTSRASGCARQRQRSRPRFTHALSHSRTQPDVLVEFDGPKDPYNPMNWPFRKKVITTVLYGLTTFSATWASAAYSPANNEIAKEFGVSTEVALLGTSLLLLGFGFGPLIWAPLSEVYGRRWAVLAPCFMAMVFSFGTATAKDIQTILITRFFSGFFGAAPITCTGGVFADIWDASQRGNAIVGYALAVAGGPVLGPIAGGAIVTSSLNWRWTEHLTGLIQGAVLLLDIMFISESYAPRLLVYKARRLRITTHNWALHAAFEEWDVTFHELAHKFLVRPLEMLLTPICFFVAVYASFIYGVFYANLAAFPIIFQEARGWDELVGSLPFLALLLGILLGSAVNVANQARYNRAFAAHGDTPVPEARLPPMMLGSVVFASGLFLLGWTADPSFPWIAPCIGAGLLGFGYYTIFQSALNYLIDTFQRWGASAIAANTFLRSVLAAAFPVIVPPLYHALGIPWAVSAFGFFAVLNIPVPFVFYFYGPTLRQKGKYTRNMG